LVDAPISKRDGHVWVGDYCCDLSKRRWSYCYSAGPFCAGGRSGHFERPFFGQWAAIERESWYECQCFKL
jgi:hypothetical protein